MIAEVLPPVIRRTLACVDDPALFASTDVLDHTLAARLCDVCPVRVPCRQVSDQRAAEEPGSLTGTHGGGLFHGGTS